MDTMEKQSAVNTEETHSECVLVKVPTGLKSGDTFIFRSVSQSAMYQITVPENVSGNQTMQVLLPKHRKLLVKADSNQHENTTSSAENRSFLHVSIQRNTSKKSLRKLEDLNEYSFVKVVAQDMKRVNMIFSLI